MGHHGLSARGVDSCTPCRQDTWSDLQLLMLLNAVLVLVGGYVKATWIDAADEPLGKTVYQASSSCTQQACTDTLCMSAVSLCASRMSAVLG